MAPYRSRKPRYAKRIQRAYRRYRARRSYPKRSLPMGYLKTIQKISNFEPIVSSVNPSWTAGQLIFNLSQLDPAQYGNLTRTFKFWRIKSVRVTFVPKYEGNSGAPAGEPQPQLLLGGTLYTSKTLDSNLLDPVTPLWPNPTTAEGCGNLKKKYLCPQTGKHATCSVAMVPRLNNWVRTTATSASSSTATIARKNTWISTGTPGCTYYGLRWGYEIPNAHGSSTMEIRVSYVFEFKGVY